MAVLPSAEVPQQRYQPISGNYVISDSDNGTLLEAMSATNIELGVTASIGTVVYVRMASTGTVRFVAGAGATLQSQGNLRTIAAQWVTVTVDKRSATEWVLSGSLA